MMQIISAVLPILPDCIPDRERTLSGSNSWRSKELRRENFSTKFEEDGIEFEEPSEYFFSFNNPIGACPVCEGYGKIIGIDESLVIPDQNLSVYQDAIACWKGDTMKKWKERLIASADLFDFPIHKPYYQLTDEQKAAHLEREQVFLRIKPVLRSS